MTDTTGTPPVGGPNRPTIEAVHRDIALANQYRMELIKYLLAIAAALFAFTVTFRPTLSHVAAPWAMWIGWLGLGVSMVGGLVHMLGWDHYYKSYRDHDWGNSDPVAGKDAGRAARKIINRWRRPGMIAQFGGFVAGVLFIGIFAAANIDNVRRSEPSQGQSCAPSAGPSCTPTTSSPAR